MEKCARPYTFQIKISKPAQPEDASNLITKTDGVETITEYVFLSSCFVECD